MLEFSLGQFVEVFPVSDGEENQHAGKLLSSSVILQVPFAQVSAGLACAIEKVPGVTSINGRPVEEETAFTGCGLNFGVSASFGTGN